MNQDDNRILKRIQSRLPRFQRDNEGKTVALVSPDKTLMINKSGTAQPGPQGEPGADGVHGQAGRDGIDGKDGMPGKDGAQGGPGIAGTNGKDGKDGAQGIQGIPGKDGAAGKDGAPGANAKRIDTYTGKTDTNGLYTVTYATPFTAIPSVQPEPPAMPNQVWVKVNSTLTGFSLRLVQRNTVNLLNIDVLLGATVNVANADARVVVIAA